MKPNQLPTRPVMLQTVLGFVTFSSLAAGLATAQTNGTWNADGSGDWSGTGNWSGGIVATGATATADFSTLDITGDHVVTLDVPYTIGTVLSQDATTPGNHWTLAGAGPLTLDNAANQPVLNVLNQSLTISSPLAGSNGFSKTGAGNLVLSGGGTMTGNVVVAAGSVLLGAADGISTSAGINVAGGAPATRVLDLNGYNQTLPRFVFTPDNSSGNLTINGSGSSKLTIETTANTELGPGGAISGSTKEVIVDLSGLNEFVWNGPANTFRAGMRFRNAADTANTSNSPGPSVTGNATVTLAGTNSITAAALAIGTTAASNSGGTSNLRLGRTNVLNASNVSIGTGGRNNGTLEFNSGLTDPTATIRGTSGGTSRVTTWDVGRVSNVTNATTWTARADFSAGELDARAGTLRIGRADTNNQANRIGTVNGIFSIGKGTLDVTNVTIGQYVGASTTTVNNTFNGNGTFNMSDAAGTVTAENIILADNLGLATGGTSRTTSGTFNLTAGTLEAKTIGKGADTGNATSVTRTFNFSSGTIRNYAGSNLSITDLPITLTGTGPRTFDVTAGQSITVAGTSGISGAGQGFTKTGTGTLSLLGANSYTGPTDVQAGTLAIANSFPGGALAVDASATLDLANVTVPAIDIDGSLNLSGPVTVTGPSGAIPGTVSNVLQYGGITGGENLNHKYRSASFALGATAADLTVAAGLDLTWTGAGGPDWDYNNTVSWADVSSNPEKFFWADTVTFDALGSAVPAVNLTEEVRPLAIVVNAAAVDYSFNGNGFIGGDGALTKSGAAKLTINNNNNSRTGVTTIHAGTLEIGSGGATGSLGSGDIVNDASLVFNRSNDITIANAISGTGIVTKLGAAVLSIITDNSHTGGTIISNGTLFVGRQTTTGSLGTGPVTNNGTLRLNRADGTNVFAYNFANEITGTGGLIVGQNTVGSAFDAVVTVTGNNSFTGDVTVFSGGLTITQASALGTGAKTVFLTNGTNGRPQLYLDGSGGNITLPAGFSLRTSSPEINRPAIGNVAGDNAIEGAITLTSGGGDTVIRVIGGSLALNGQISTNTTGRNLRLGGNTGANGTIHGKLTNGTNPWGINVQGPNTWTITNDTNDYTGTTTVSGGTLLIDAVQTSATGAITVNTGATLGGTGTLGGATTVNAGGILAPGSSVGTLTAAASVTIAGTLATEINGAAADRLDVVGTLDISNATIDFDEIAAASGSPIIIASYGTLSGAPFASVIDLPAGYSIVYNYNSLNQIALVNSGGDYNTWAGSFGLDPLTDGAPGFDKDNDGLTNQQEYAFGLDPVSGSSVSPITSPLGKAGGTFKYTRRVTSLTGLNYSYESSTTLGAGWPSFTPVSEVSNGGSPVEEITVTVPAGLLTSDKRFVRVLAN